ncbi:hypothetical protein [Sulfitobacter sp. JB4-11]|uniref:hypothetical protein n=1 Tax=Sulfitobacter rhodophyticola TaxID=3238304 RepID=UPI003515FE0F
MKTPACPPQTFFVTLRLADRRSDLLVREVGCLRQALRATLSALPFTVDAATVLPALAHMVWVLPEGDASAASRVLMLKRRFAQLVAPVDVVPQGAGVWHRDHWICRLETTLEHARHRTVIHQAAVEAGLCAQPQDWPHVSLHRDLRHAAAAPMDHLSRQEKPVKAREAAGIEQPPLREASLQS